MSTSCHPANQDHPCYSHEAHGLFARIHLPVAPACNIQCNYCNRKFDCSNESRPGVTTTKLSPEESVKKVLYAGSKIEGLSVAGIAGPGDALANPKQTFKTLELLGEYAPDLKLCISTNGLMLPFYAKKLKELGVDHLTVTLNAIHPSVGAKIYAWVYDTHSKKRYTKEEGAELLLNRQLKGIEECVRLGMMVKINSVLIPGVNEEELPHVAKKIKSMGVALHNIMPLLSLPEFGTYFSDHGVPSATDAQVEEMRKRCDIGVEQMSHCRQCRADAVGILGEDRSSEFAQGEFLALPMEKLATLYDLPSRRVTKELLLQKREAIPQKGKLPSMVTQGKLIAITSRLEERADLHFGDAKEFIIYEWIGDHLKAVGVRRLEGSYCQGKSSCHEANPIEEILQKLHDIDYLVTAKIGKTPREKLQKAGITCIEAEGMRLHEALGMIAPQELEAN